MSRSQIIPFFVADRPASLRILKGVMLKNPDIKVGLMTHALTTKNFTQLFCNYPYNIELRYEDASFLDNEDLLAENLIKIADSGVFTRNGCTISYDDLFMRYNQLGVEFGVIIDTLRDPKETVQSAMKGFKIYASNRAKYKFKLIAVAQGKTLDEYLKCYRELQQHFEYVAVGGLLKKRENSARWVNVQSEKFMYDVLETIKRDYSPDWLFALGCYHPSRHKKFEVINVWGSDYKGWIFNYATKIDTLMILNKDLTAVDQNNGFSNGFKKLLKRTEKLEANYVNSRGDWNKEKDPSKKHELRIKIEKLKTELENAYGILLLKRQTVVKSNHLPVDYRESLLDFERRIALAEQDWRFKQVRTYIEEKVYAQLQ
jgi:hypothetical protein